MGFLEVNGAYSTAIIPPSDLAAKANTGRYQGGGCIFDPAVISVGQVFLNEVYSSSTLLFLSFGVGLDPRQALLFGPTLGPLFVGMSLGLVSFASTGMAGGYSGAGMNPSRCFAFAIARNNMDCE